jgi:WD40 repeat protein
VNFILLRPITIASLLQGHKGEVLDIDFNPFAPNVIATASDDTNLKVWCVTSVFDVSFFVARSFSYFRSIPADGITSAITASDYTLEG